MKPVLSRDDQNLEEFFYGHGLSGARCSPLCLGVGEKAEKGSGRFFLEHTVSYAEMTATLQEFRGGFQCCEKARCERTFVQILFRLRTLKQSSVLISSPAACLSVWPHFPLTQSQGCDPSTRCAAVGAFAVLPHRAAAARRSPAPLIPASRDCRLTRARRQVRALNNACHYFNFKGPHSRPQSEEAVSSE